ncbi:MAG: heavy-metal-associated domain-containing protein [Vicingus serpentipes]|nr:heavy-metal-associated domain-containing protein [Vicingus serpentipes]
MKAELKIEGLSCAHCVNAVGSILRNSKGVQKVEVSLPDNAQVIFDENEITLEQLKQAINESEIYKTT